MMDNKKEYLPSKLETSVLFNLFFFTDVKGWKSRSEMITFDISIEKMIGDHSFLASSSLIFCWSNNKQDEYYNNLPKILARLEERGFIEKDEKIKPNRWRIKRTLRNISTIYSFFELKHFNDNSIFSKKILDSPLLQIYQVEFKKESLNRWKNNYELSLFGVCSNYELIHAKMDLKEILRDIERKYYELNPWEKKE